MKLNLLRKINIKISYKNFLLLLSTSMLILSLTAVSMQTYFKTTRFMLDKVEDSNISGLLQSKKTLEDNLIQIRNLTSHLTSDNALIDYINQYESSTGIEKNNIRARIQPILTKILVFNKLVANVIVLTDQDSFSASKSVPMNYNDFKMTRTYNQLKLQSSSEPILFEPLSRENSFMENDFFFSSIIEKNGHEIGSVFIVLKPNFFSSIIGNNGSFVVLDRLNRNLWNGSLIKPDDMSNIKNNYSNLDENFTGVQTYEVKKGKVYVSSCLLNKWKLVFLQQVPPLRKEIIYTACVLLLSSIFLTISELFLSRIASTKIMKPIKNLMTAISIYGKKKLIPGIYRGEANTKSSLNQNIFFFFIFTVIIPVMLYMVFTYAYSSRIMQNYIVKSYENTFNQATINLQQFFIRKKAAILSMIFDEKIQWLLTLSADKMPFTESDLLATVDSYMDLQNTRDDILIYEHDGELAFKNTLNDLGISPVKSQQMFESKKLSTDIFTWGAYGVFKNNQPIMDLFVRINSKGDFSEIGYLECRVSEYNIENIYRSLLKDNVSLFILDNNGIIVSHPDKSLINTKYSGTKLSGNHIVLKDSFILRSELSTTPLILVGRYDNSIFNKDLLSLAYDKLYMMILIIFIHIIISFVISLSATSYIRKMNALLKVVGMDNTEIHFPEENRIHEFNELSMAFNEMIIRIESLMDQVLIATKKQNELNNRKKEAEMAALQSQINPHFLYNTFGSINCLIENGDKQNAVRMVSALSAMLRFVACTDNIVVSISEELQYLKMYIDIMKIRYSDTINFNFLIDKAMLSYKTVKLTLQPLVENAIIHGIETVTGIPGTITIQGIILNSTIRFIVSDNGSGIPVEKLSKLNDSLKVNTGNKNIGLHNVQNRIKLFFGEQYGLTITNIPEGGTSVQIEIPLIV